MVRCSMFKQFPWRLRLVSTTFLILVLTETSVHAEKLASIIIDDVGNNFKYGQDVINLPATLTIAILPRTTYAKDLARLATKNNKEVMLHLPLQSVEHQKRSPGTLDLHMTRDEFNKQLRSNLNSVPYIRGVNNHMGSLLTRHPGHMTWLMDELSRRGGLYFVDSKTSSKSIADKIAAEHKIPNLSRDFFLDPDHEKNTLRQQFDLFIQKINQRGYALAIAHPYPETIKFLKTHLNELSEQGITLIPVSELVHTADQLNKKRENHHVACTSTTCSRL
ncbi:MAG: divergent polysaccharide deacetylase family protein [Gammaproteobacteria bacterium]|nr:MAG: divergent polysaccharide deacetylase family protein [Gammaproteobacteria bacterium]